MADQIVRYINYRAPLSAGAQQNGDKFGSGESIGAVNEEPFARALLNGPVAHAQTFFRRLRLDFNRISHVECTRLLRGRGFLASV